MTPPLTRAAIVAEARSWIGTRYCHQASLKGVGCDCLGLVRGVWRACVGEEPETPPALCAGLGRGDGRGVARERRVASSHSGRARKFRRGDVLLFRWRDGFVAKHVAIAAGSSTMIHAHDGASVCEVAIAPWWRRRLAYAFAFPGVTCRIVGLVRHPKGELAALRPVRLHPSDA